MTREKIYLFDTTLRDGQQTPGIDFSVEDKIAIASMLDEFGLDYVEGGYPGANPTDSAFFSEKRTTRANSVMRCRDCTSARRRRRWALSRAEISPACARITATISAICHE